MRIEEGERENGPHGLRQAFRRLALHAAFPSSEAAATPPEVRLTEICARELLALAILADADAADAAAADAADAAAAAAAALPLEAAANLAALTERRPALVAVVIEALVAHVPQLAAVADASAKVCALLRGLRLDDSALGRGDDGSA